MTAASTRRTPSSSRPVDQGEARASLAAERVAAAGRIAALERDIAVIMDAARAGATDDEHDPEGATIAFERAQAMALLEEARLQVEVLDQALDRVDAGSYGRCEACGGAIAPERLAARPAATHCIGCASRLR